MPFAKLTFDPWELPPEERKARFVGREPLLQEILAAVGEQQAHATAQHYLLLGPRGIGKTTLLLTLRERIKESPVLSSKWFCVQLREENYYVRTLRDLLALVVSGLAEDEQLPEAQTLAEQVRDERDDERSSALALGALRELSAAGGKRVLLLIDNFDQLFPSTPRGRGKARPADNEFRAFRKLLATEQFLMVVGASVRLFEEIAAYDKAFFDFFCPIDVPDLSDDEICELLKRCAEAEANYTFLQQFEKLRDKVRAITYLAGGNPRLVLMLYDVLRHGDMTTVVEALRETVAGLTPMLKQVMDDMPRQQSKTLDGLARLRGAASPKEISTLVRLPLNVVTAQLDRLRDGRFVTLEGGGKGRAATYRIADPLFHTWYQIRYLRPQGRRVELFVEFIRAWFSVEERRSFLKEMWSSLAADSPTAACPFGAEKTLAIQYYANALDDTAEASKHIGRLADLFVTSGNRRGAAFLLAESAEPAVPKKQFESDGYRLLGDRMRFQNIPEAIAAYSEAIRKNPNDSQARYKRADCYLAQNDYKRAIQEATSAIASSPAAGEHRARALIVRGRANAVLNENAAAVADYSAAIALKDASAGDVALALLNRGFTRGKAGDSQGAMDDFSTAIHQNGATAGVVAEALFSRGFTRGQSGDIQGAIADFAAAIELKNTPVELMAKALLCRAAARGQSGDIQGAIDDFSAAIHLNGAPAEIVAEALFSRGFARGQSGDSQGSIIDYSAVIELKNAPVEPMAKALFNRGFTRGKAGDGQGAIDDFSAAIELKNAPVTMITKALVNRGSRRGQSGDIQGAIADFSAAIQLKDAPADQVVLALLNRGIAQDGSGDIQGAITDYSAVIEIKGAAADQVALALVNRGLTRRRSGDSQGEIADYSAAIELKNAPPDQVARALCNRGFRRGQLGDTQGEIADYSVAIERKDVPTVHLALALVNRGSRRGRSGDIRGAIVDYSAAIQLKEAPVALVATALFNRGTIRGQSGDSQGAIVDYSAALEFEGGPGDHVAKVLFYRGFTRGQSGDVQGAIEDYSAALEFNDAPADLLAEALVKRGFTRGQLGDSQGAIDDYSAVIELEGAPAEPTAIALIARGMTRGQTGDSTGNITDLNQAMGLRVDARTGYIAFDFLIRIHLAANDRDAATQLMLRLTDLEPENTSIDVRLEKRVSTITHAAKDHGLETAELLYRSAMEGSSPDIRERLQFLGSALAYAQTSDERVLFALPESERTMAKEIAKAIKPAP